MVNNPGRASQFQNGKDNEMKSRTRDPGILPKATSTLPLADRPGRIARQGRRPPGLLATFEMDQNGFITYWSPKAEQLYGYEAYQITGKHAATLYTPGDLIHGKLRHELQCAGAKGAYFTFGWQKRENEEAFWAYSEWQAVKDDRGRLLGYRKSVVETTSES
jgi:PAS domain S-box-containing protein